MSDPLLVPMNMNAMILNQAASASTPFARFFMQYGNLTQFESPEPQPFSADTQQPTAGIYLHWTLPDGLRHGLQNDDSGSIDFPYIPNRWLVTRVGLDGSIKAWIIESDYLDPQQGTSAYAVPNQLDANGAPIPTKIGQSYLLSSPPAPELRASPNALFLQAVAPGSVWFTMYEPDIQNVLAFFDDVTDNTTPEPQPIDSGEFTYTLIGWYADPTTDPLHTATWQADSSDDTLYSLQCPQFDWTVYTTPDNLPASMLVHATCPVVPWDRNADNPPAQNYPTDIQQDVQVAVGNTAIDALAAIIRAQQSSSAEADMLEAFYYNLLDTFDQPGSQEALSMAIRERWYGSSNGGTRWTIVKAEQQNSALPPQPTVPLTEAQKQALAALNTAQFELDRQSRILESMQWTLAGLWWKYKWQGSFYNTVPLWTSNATSWISAQLALHLGQAAQDANGNPCNAPDCNDNNSTDPTSESWYWCKVQAQLNLVTQLQTDQANAQSAVPLDTNQVLKEIPLDPYYTPNDPVVLALGLGRCSTNYDPTGTLLCRMPAQALLALTINGATYCAAGSCDHVIGTQFPVLSDPQGLLPTGVQTLYSESFFLSPREFAQAVFNDVTQAPAVQTALEAAAKATPALNTLFPPPWFTYQVWEQPWIPLLLEWQVTVLNTPAYTAPNDNPNQENVFNRATWVFDQQDWQFNGTDYIWTGPTSGDNNFDEGASEGMQFTGRTFITPHAVMTLAAQLDAYVKQHQFRNPDLKALLEALDQYVDQIESLDVLSQSLSGMMANMIERTYWANVSPTTDPTMQDLIGSSFHGLPQPFASAVATDDTAPWSFAPLRGSFFVIQQLTVIDNFGRSIDLMLANQNAKPENSTDAEYYFYPYAGRDLRASATIPLPPNPNEGVAAQRMLQLAPRAIQDSRLAFDPVSNDGTNTNIDLLADANPICGWVVPNHLDRSLALYAPDGTAWGELYLSAHYVNGTQTFVPVWQPDPTNPDASATIDAIPNQYVKDMLTALAGRTDNGEAIADFIEVIDETLWTIDPAQQPDDQNLSVLIGVPLAIVRASLSLKVRGLPYINQDWWNTFQVDVYEDIPQDYCSPTPLAQLNGNPGDSLWQIRLGSQSLRDDGLIGYFLDDAANASQTYNTFYAVYVPDEVATDPYFQPIQMGNFFSLRFIDDSVATPDPTQNQQQFLTMLIDPRAKVHAFSGILPVTELEIPDMFITDALKTMQFVFRSGPFMTPPDSVQIPQPADQKGAWSWFDRVLNNTVGITDEDGKVRFPTIAPMIKEGWLKFKPNPPLANDTEEKSS